MSSIHEDWTHQKSDQVEFINADALLSKPEKKKFVNRRNSFNKAKMNTVTFATLTNELSDSLKDVISVSE